MLVILLCEYWLANNMEISFKGMVKLASDSKIWGDLQSSSPTMVVYKTDCVINHMLLPVRMVLAGRRLHKRQATLGRPTVLCVMSALFII